MKKTKIYLIASGKSIVDSIVISNTGYDVEISKPYIFPNKVIEWLHYLWGRDAMSLLRSVIPMSAWRKFYCTSTLGKNSLNTIFIFAPGNKIDRNIDVLSIKSIKKDNKIKTVLLLFDSMKSLSKSQQDRVGELFAEFDLVMTFDRFDAEKYGILHFSLPYDKRDLVNESKNRTDIFFVGHNKGREPLLIEIIKRAKQHSVISDFSVSRKLSDSMSARTDIGIIYGYMDYHEVLKRIGCSNCLLEVLCEGQKASTLRYCEAVSYNKKLLTNNPDIIHMPFFDSRYMKVFQTVTDIDFEWIKKREEVNYNYDGSFGWNRLLARIEEELEHENKR